MPLIMFKGKKSLLVSSHAHVRKRALLQCIRFPLFFNIKFYLHSCILHAAYLLHRAIWCCYFFLFCSAIDSTTLCSPIYAQSHGIHSWNYLSSLLSLVLLLFPLLITHSLSKTEHEIDYARNDDFLTLFRCFGVLHLQLFYPPHAMTMQFSLCYDIW